VRPVVVSVGTWPTDQPSRAEIRHTATEVFGRDEFQHRKGLLQRFVEWLAHFFPHTSGRGGSFSAASNLFFYLAMAALVMLLAFLVVVVVRSIRRRPRKEKVDDVETEVDPEVERTVSEWRSAAEVAEAEGRWKEAMRCRYRELVGELIERGVVRDIPGLTTGELRAEVSSTASDELGPFSEASTLFELPWYARQPTGPEENRRIRQLTAGMLDRLPSRVDVPVDDDDAELEVVG
jgi:hypothetical protein